MDVVDPYKILGVSRKAKPETIERHYRERARQAHPDHGGDAEAFKALQMAYELLMDPARRAQFDRTGEIPSPMRDDRREAIKTIAATLHTALSSIIKNGADPLKLNVLAIVSGAIANRRDQVRTALRGLEKTRDRLEAAARRFTAKDWQDNFLAAMARAPLVGIEPEIAIATKDLATLELAIKLLSRFDYRMDVAQKPDWTQHPEFGGVQFFWPDGTRAT